MKSMIAELKLTNFRGFKEHQLSFRPLTIIVGRNNAGKSSIVEALRLIAIVTARYENLAYHAPKDWLKIPARLYGASIDIRNLQIDVDTLCYEYNDPPAIIEAKFRNGSAIQIFLGDKEKQIHAVLLNSKGYPARDRYAAYNLDLPRVSILPQIGPLAREEKVIGADYVRGAMDSHLASSHFRNQLKIYPELFAIFKDLSEETWPNLQIMPLDYGNGYPDDPIYLSVRNEEFVGEAAKMGHGLQMWLQTMWFLARAKNASTLILDEPDVYLHADLQRRLIRQLKAIGCQIIIATHSVEIMSEVEPDNIMIVERKRKHSRFADSIPAVQSLIERVGSTQNLHLSRLWNSKRFIIVEGDDLKILKTLYDVLFPSSDLSLEAIPNMTIGGWGGWSLAIGSSLALRNAFGEKVIIYCIFDSDYHCDDEIKERFVQAEERGVELCIWQRKEIENYLLNGDAIARYFKKRVPDNPPSASEICIKMQTLANELREEVHDGIATEILARNHGLGVGGANKKARYILQQKTRTEGNMINIASGKKLLSKVAAWAQQGFKVNINAISLAREMRQDEIPIELQNVLRAIEAGNGFPKR